MTPQSRRPRDSMAAAHRSRPVVYTSQRQPVQPVTATPPPVAPTEVAESKVYNFNLALHKPRLRPPAPLRRLVRTIRGKWQTMPLNRRRLSLVVLVAVLLVTIVAPAFDGLLEHKAYALTASEAAVLLPTNKLMASKLKLNSKDKDAVYEYNQDYKASNVSQDISTGGPLIKAKIYQDPSKGVQVTDPINNVDFTITPMFDLGGGKQQQNRVVFPAFNGGGHLVYTAGAIGVKQEVTLQHNIGDSLSYRYKLDLGDQYEARLENSGSVGVYGTSSPLAGNVSTGDAKDAALLKKARQKAVKDKLMFEIPAPTIKESGSHLSDAKASYALKGDILTVSVVNLDKASYPLSIDPTVTAAFGYGQFTFDANLDTDVYIDPTNNFFERSPLTGGNLLTWTGSTSTTAAHFLGAAAVYGGTLYVIGGATTTTTNIQNGSNTHLIEQAKINSNGSLGSFTDGNYTGLPSNGLSRFNVLAYNGYIYLIGGLTGFTSVAAGGAVNSTLYYTRITSESLSAFSNGSQLKNWSTSSNVPTTAVYDFGATVSNGYMYVAGGLNSAGTAQTQVQYANILPSGAPGTWTGGLALTTATFGLDMQSYNGRLYVIGGNTGTLTAATLSSSVMYVSTNTDGSIADASWKSTNSLVNSGGTASQAMENLGSSFTMIYNGYIYATGGCTTVNSTGSCTAVANYSQLAQVNADGSLGTFFPNDFQSGGTATLQRTGTPTVGYNGTLYSVAGCSAMNTGTVSCLTTSLTSNYVAVNSDAGDVSDNHTPTSLPVGLFGHATAVVDGFIYVIGGCLTVSCNGSKVANYNTYYASISSTGTLGSFSTNTVATSALALHFDGNSGDNNCSTGGTDQCGLAGIAVAVQSGYIYVAGGNDGSAYSKAIYYMSPTAAGVPTAWTKDPNQFNTAVTELGLLGYGQSIYVIGGCNGTTGIGCSTYVTQVQRATINSTGALAAPFTNTNNNTNGTQQLQLPANGRSAFGLVSSGSYVYLAGGIDNANNQLDTVMRAKINSSGDIVAATGSAWTNCTGTMSQPRRRTVATVVNGFLYVIGGHNAADTTGPPGGANGTTYGDIQIGQIDMSTGGSGNITSFSASSSGTVTRRWNPAIAFSNGYMFVTGGCTAGPPPTGCTTIGTIDESFVVYNANNLGTNTWNNVNNYSAVASNRMGAGAVAYNGYLYVAGGCLSFTFSSFTCNTPASNASSDVVYAPINADGTLGTWVKSGNSLPAARYQGQLVTINGWLYWLGGADNTGTPTKTVYYSQIGAAGAPGSWTTISLSASGALPNAVYMQAATVFANRIYISGGDNGSGSVNNVYFSEALPTGGSLTTAWTSATSPGNNRREMSFVSSGLYVYLINGYNTGTSQYGGSVYVAAPNTSTGAISSWTKLNLTPTPYAGMTAFAANGYIYISGGHLNTAGSVTNNTYFAPVNTDGTLSDWQFSPNEYTGKRFAAAGAYYNGYIYVTGGHDGTAVVTSNLVQQSGQLSEAIHTTYSRYVDFGTDATFRQLYVLGSNAQLNGVDVDRWKIIVKTSTSFNNAWGQNYTTTLFGLTTGPTYGTPITFQALDASGVDQGAAQFWDITFDIDQSNTFSFPDSNQAQISKYDFYFSPGPGKRLRDGKTFVNEQQSTLDAHP